MNDFAAVSGLQMSRYHLERLDIRSFTPRDVMALSALRFELKMGGLPAGAELPRMTPLLRSDVEAALSAGAVILVARESIDRGIVGMGMLITYRKWGDTIGWVEEVATLPGWRRQGISRAINFDLIERARKKGCKEINLTSSLLRAPARALYESLGYVKRSSNIYRLVL